MILLDPIFYPLARLAIRRGWHFSTLAARLRQAYLAAAQDEAGPDATDSRLSVLTGLQRRDIARLRQTQTAPPTPRRQPLAEIIATWRDDPTYDTSGIPVQGDAGSFTSLARSVRTDVHARTFLDVLIEIGAVEEKGGLVQLKARTYNPLAGSDDQLGYLADSVGDHLEVAVSNVIDGANKFDVSVHYHGLSDSAIARLDAYWREKQTDLLCDLNDMARALPPSDDGPNRFRAGAFFHEDPRVRTH